MIVNRRFTDLFEWGQRSQPFSRWVDVVELEPDPPFGVLPDVDFRVQPVALEPGDRLVFVTDGVTDRLAEGMEHFRLARAGADPEIEAAARTSLGMLAHLAGRDREAAGYLRRALAHDSRTEALARNNLGLAEARLGRGAAALSLHRDALAHARRTGNTPAVRAILLGLGETSLRLGRPAEQPFREALELTRAGRFRMQEALALDGLAHATGDPAWWRVALSILTDLGVDRAELVRRHLADPAGRWCDLCRVPSTVDRARPLVRR